MKTLRRSFLAVMFLTASSLVWGQTVPNVNQLGCRTNVPSVVMAVPLGSVIGVPLIRLTCVPIDTNTLKVDPVTGKLTAIIPATSVVPVFVDAETPGGTLDGTNTVFTLAAAPSPAASLVLYRNGVRLKAGFDYTLTAATITFLTGAVPQSGLQPDVLLADYRK